jgi:hypothetical protein
LNLLRESARSDDVERLLALDPVLEAPELFLFRPVVEGGHEDNDDDGDQNGHALDPAVVLLFDDTD